MKILFINRADAGGGAATAMRRMANGLEEKYHTKNYFIVEIKRTHNNSVFEVRPKLYEKICERILEKFLRVVGLPYLYLPFSARNILRMAKQIRPDVISLHNIHGGYFQTSLLPELSKIAPIIWTFHDMWPITRNAAHTFGNTSWKRMNSFSGEKYIYPPINLDTGNYMMRRKYNIYKDTNMMIVTPSKWLEEIAKSSPLLKNIKIFQIYHGVDLMVYKPGNKKRARKKMGIPKMAKVVMFGADFLKNNPFKGGSLLTDVLVDLDRMVNSQVYLLIVGKYGECVQRKYVNLKIIYVGNITNEKMMAVCYQSADCFINPTRADSLSLVLIEACACGTPSITYNVGGTKEVIKNGLNGYLVRLDDSKSFAKKIISSLEDIEFRKKVLKNSREIVHNKFNIQSQIKEYYSLFRTVL
jgi:glycosyltransferase involved in cell wall biosynthesis